MSSYKRSWRASLEVLAREHSLTEADPPLWEGWHLPHAQLQKRCMCSDEEGRERHLPSHTGQPSQHSSERYHILLDIRHVKFLVQILTRNCQATSYMAQKYEVTVALFSLYSLAFYCQYRFPCSFHNILKNALVKIQGCFTSISSAIC